MIHELENGGDTKTVLSPYFVFPPVDEASPKFACSILAALDTQGKLSDVILFTCHYMLDEELQNDRYYFKYKQYEAHVHVKYGMFEFAWDCYRELITQSITARGFTDFQTIESGLGASLTLVHAGLKDAAVRVAYFFLRATYPMQKSSSATSQDAQEPPTPTEATSLTLKAIKIIRDNFAVMKDKVVKSRMKKLLRRFDSHVDLQLGTGFCDLREANAMLFNQIWGT